MADKEMENSTEKKQKKSMFHVLFPLVVIFCLMTIMVYYTTHVIRKVAVSNVKEVGEDRISGVAAQMENYLETTKSVVWVTADTVDHMCNNGASTKDILRYIVEESDKQSKQFDNNYTGIYGYIRGEYLDGVNWEPYEGYVATERDWYKAAIEANGETVIVSPYVDAQTNAVIISICRMLSNGEDVLSLDLTMNYIQDLVSELQIKGKGYGFFFNEDGLIIAHPDEKKKGQFLTANSKDFELMAKSMEVKDGYFEMEIDGKKSTVFVKQIMDQWYSVIIISNAELYSEVVQQMFVNIAISFAIFILIALSHLLGYRNERKYVGRIEEMRVEEQRQAYEAKALKIEKEAADASNKAKSDFLAQMSHEIRTPINAVIGLDEMILRETKEENITEYAQDIKSASKTLLTLINELLDFSRIESGKMEIIPVKYKTKELINSVGNMIVDRAEKKNLELFFDIDEKIPRVLYGDDVRIRQVVTNLLTKAVKYTEKGSVILTVKAEEITDNDCTLYVEVKDTGIGIREEDMEKLFESFRRIDERRNRNVEGTGLGMPIVVGLLSKMNSKVEVESVYGEGSKFFFRIRQELIDPTPIGEYKQKYKADRKQNEKKSIRVLNASILVVDDNVMNLKVAKGLMKRLGIVPDLAESGRIAMEMAGKKHYDLIFMDHMMPDLDGIETLKRMRDSALIERNTPVIALTANAISGAREVYIEAGFEDYLSKPIAPEELEGMVEKYLPAGSFEYLEKKAETDDGKTDVEESASAKTAGKKDPGNDEGLDTTKRNEELLEKLKAKGFHVEAAMGYVMNDVTFYKELLETFVENEKSNSKEIKGFYESKNWDEYKTRVHALKSSSRTIGADRLSELALEQETASKERNTDVINAGVEGLLAEYFSVAGEVNEILGQLAPGSAQNTEEEDSDDMEIMDFYPGE